ncbi:MAG: hypothetical protein AMJ69_12510 [Gammaproteobacteria bacterium SG8_47]|nr:MAG: hypothetical protein AMJ69_12510 [Gammaproteobacteria bacterium SG8_47]
MLTKSKNGYDGISTRYATDSPGYRTVNARNAVDTDWSLPMNLRPLAVLVLGTLVAVGCQSAPVDRERSTSFTIPTGTVLVLNQELTIPGETASVLIQEGKVALDNKVRRYHPHCRLEVRERKPQAQTIQPDSFVVTRVRDFYEVVQSGPLRLAQLDTPHPAIVVASDASPTWNYITELRLESERQPNVFQLQCMQWNAPPNDDYVTVEQIRGVLGEIITLELAD